MSNNNNNSDRIYIILGVLGFLLVMSSCAALLIRHITKSDTSKKSSSPAPAPAPAQAPAPAPDTSSHPYFEESVHYTIKGSRDGKYCADASDTGMICNRTVASDWEKFQFIYQGDNKYAIKSNRTNKQCKDNRGSVSKCDTDWIREHEKFLIEKHGDKYSIKGGNGDKYCSDQPTGFVCDTEPLDAWEKFTITKA